MNVDDYVDRSNAPDKHWFPVEAIDAITEGPFVQRIVAGTLGEVHQSPRVRFRLDPGTLVVFDGGRRFHQVLPVRGARNR